MINITIVFFITIFCIVGGIVVLIKTHHKTTGIFIIIAALLFTIASLWVNNSLYKYDTSLNDKQVITQIANNPQYYISYDLTVSNEITKNARPGIYATTLVSIVNSDLPSDIIVRLYDDILDKNGHTIVPRGSILEVNYSLDSSIKFDLKQIVKPTGEVIIFNNQKIFRKSSIEKPIHINMGTQGVIIIN